MDDKLAKSSIDLARNQGQMAGYAAASKLLLREDREFVEILRANAWQKDGCKTIYMKDEQLQGVPTGWPEGTNGDEYVGEYLEKLIAAPDTPGDGPSGPAGPVLKSFRESLDAEG